MATSNSNEEGSNSVAERPKLQTNTIGAFVAGIALANFNKNLLLGFVIGTIAGAYTEQTLPGQFPNVRQFWYDLKQKWQSSRPK